jgi:hypothetical protein
MADGAAASTHAAPAPSLEGIDYKAFAADVELRARLVDDGWLAGHEVYRTEDDRALHGGAERGPEGDMWLKDGVVLDIERKRMDDAVAGEAEHAGEFIQVISLWSQADYPFIERFESALPQQAPSRGLAPPGGKLER